MHILSPTWVVCSVPHKKPAWQFFCATTHLFTPRAANSHTNILTGNLIADINCFAAINATSLLAILRFCVPLCECVKQWQFTIKTGLPRTLLVNGFIFKWSKVDWADNSAVADSMPYTRGESIPAENLIDDAPFDLISGIINRVKPEMRVNV